MLLIGNLCLLIFWKDLFCYIVFDEFVLIIIVVFGFLLCVLMYVVCKLFNMCSEWNGCCYCLNCCFVDLMFVLVRLVFIMYCDSEICLDVLVFFVFEIVILIVFIIDVLVKLLLCIILVGLFMFLFKIFLLMFFNCVWYLVLLLFMLIKNKLEFI